MFVNYRVGDRHNEAAFIAEALAGRFGAGQVFLASRSLRPGEDFERGLVAEVRRCSVLLCVIGPGWLAAKDQGGRRLDDPGDWVRREVAEALASGLTVIPVLIGDRGPVAMPARDELPPDMRGLAVRHYVRMHYRDLRLDQLVAAVLAADPALATSEVFARPPARPRAWAPSMLLRADYGIVPFTGRTHELAQLRGWCEHPAALAARLLTGPGGQGKTRLAQQAVAQAQQRGWVAGAVSESTPPGAIDRLRMLDAALLLVVDYAEGRTEQLVELGTALADRPSDRPGRLLLITRSAGEWRGRLRGHGDDRISMLFSTMTEQRLGPLTGTAPSRRAEFLRALAAFGDHLGHPVRGVPVPPGIDDPEDDPGGLGRGFALDLHAAALSSLLDTVDQPADADADPVARVLDHEKRYWRRTLPEHGLTAGGRRPDAVVAVATLFTAADLDTAVAFVEGLDAFDGDTKPVLRSYVEWAAEQYPGPDRLNPMLPDRLGEEHVAAVLWGSPDVAVVPARRAADSQVTRALTVLGRALPRHGDIEPVLRQFFDSDAPRVVPMAVTVAPELDEPRPFATALTDALRAHSNVELLDRVRRALPGESVALADLAVLTTALTLDNARQHTRVNPIRTAHLLRLHSIHLHAAGDEEGALEAARAAVAVLEELPNRHLPALASALTTVADRLAALGLHAEGLAPIDRAVSILRDLAAETASYRDELASALYSRADYRHEFGRFEEALADAVEMVGIHRESERRQPGSSLASLASGLVLLATCHGAVGDWTQQRAAIAEAADSYRRLADHNPDGYLQSLGAALGQLASARQAAGDQTGALAASTEATTVRRTLAERYPAAHQAELARSLIIHGGVLTAGGDHEAALDAITQAVGILTELESRLPGPNWRALLTARMALAEALNAADRTEEGLAHAADVTDRWRQRVTTDRMAYLPDLAGATLAHASLLHAAGQSAAALVAARDAVSLYQELAAGRPDAYAHLLARALNNLAIQLNASGRPQEAIEAITQTLETRHTLAAADPDAHRGELATAYSNLANILDETGQAERSLAAASQALRILNDVSSRNPAYQRHVATVASTLGVRLAGQGRVEEGVRTCRLAVTILRPLAESSPAVFTADLALALNNLSLTTGALGYDDEAFALATEAVELRTRLVETNRGPNLSGLAHALYSLSLRLGDAGHTAQATDTASRAVAAFRELAARHPDTPSTRLAMALLNHAGQIEAAGGDPTEPAEEAIELFQAAAGDSDRYADHIRVLRQLIDPHRHPGDAPSPN